MHFPTSRILYNMDYKNVIHCYFTHCNMTKITKLQAEVLLLTGSKPKVPGLHSHSPGSGASYYNIILYCTSD